MMPPFLRRLLPLAVVLAAAVVPGVVHAQGGALKHPMAVAAGDEATLVFPLAAEETWSWYRPGTTPNALEYAWFVRGGEAPSAGEVGFYLFKHPRAEPATGTFADLLAAGQLSVSAAERIAADTLADGAVTVRYARSVLDLPADAVTAEIDAGALLLRLRGPAVAALFGERPSHVFFFTQTPEDAEMTRREVPVKYR